jgi:indole-3-glycerol phosphate synthase
MKRHLDPIVRDVRRRAAERRERLSLAELSRSVRPEPERRERFLSALSGSELAIIAELKRRSPSAGTLVGKTASRTPERAAWTELAFAYARGGAAALSVLTEEDHFAGSLDDLAAGLPARLPRLRKDFILDEGMVLESALHGADAILLLPVILDGSALGELHSLAREIGLAALVEVHDERELERALALEPDIVGVNARDLATFDVDLATVERVLPLVPKRIVRVAESGLRTSADLHRVRAAGADAALVGEALVRSRDPEAELIAWREELRG